MIGTCVRLLNRQKKSVVSCLRARKYCLKVPSFLGGEYGGDNLAIAPLIEIIGISGDIAKQTAGLPDCATIKLQVVD